jgi:hypothetical protein
MPKTDSVAEPNGAPESRLGYTPRFGPGGPVTVRGVRLLVVLTLINTTLLGMSVLGPQLFPFLRQQWQQWQAGRAAERRRQAGLARQRQCLAYAPAADEVVYEEDSAAATRLLKEGKGRFMSVNPDANFDAPFGWVGPVKAEPPSYYPQFTDVVFGTRISDVRAPLLFLHE